MKHQIKHDNGFINYTITKDEIVVTFIHVSKRSQRQGIGTALINDLKLVAKYLKLPISLLSCPMNSTIDVKGLNEFYIKNGFILKNNLFYHESN
jgi:GNAT superfamily N-acetyltransferase